MKIAIIGAGLSGSNILKNLFDNRFIEDNEIFIFDPRNALGPGFPYEKDSLYKLLNVQDRFMSMTDDDLGFVKWLKTNNIEYQNFEEMTSRNYYGDYLKELYKPYYEHNNVTIIHKEVTDIDVDQNTYKIKTDNWVDDVFEAVFLTIGHPEYADHYDLRGEKNYIHNPYPLDEKLSHFTENDRIGIIGAGATSLDIFRYIMQTYNLEYPFYIFTRDSIFNIPHINLINENFKFSISDEWVDAQLAENNGLIPLDNILKLIDSDLKSEGVDFIKSYEKIKDLTLDLYRDILKNKPQDIALITEYFERFTKYFSKLFAMLPKEDADKYLSTYHNMVDAFRTLTPPKTTEWLLSSIETGKVKIVKGLKEINVVQSGQLEAIADETILMDYLINTTGFDFNIKNNSDHNILIRNLYDKKIIDPDINGNYVNITWPDANIISKRYGNLVNLYMIGMWVFGTHYRANDIRSIKEVARVVTNRFIEKNK